MVEHENTWQSARILTDLRPVFGPTPTDPPVAVVLIHNLRIAYRKGGRLQEFFVAMDSNDLKALQGAVERAVKKESSLQSLTKRTGIRCLVVEPE
jgi:hypothetical protein